MHRKMGSFADVDAVENLLNTHLTREFRVTEDRVVHMAEKMEQKPSSLEKQSVSQRQESLTRPGGCHSAAASLALRKSNLLPIQNTKTQSMENLALEQARPPREEAPERQVGQLDAARRTG
ncbi:hypothetical protein PR003_g8646 [Phytophthora rubi]|uniref:Uncharacterized protein n=2 Tax=Phytophthora rubi TaxID=129364 RepID=A0A6A3MXU9_9STRA|nr:hypothetical protein PR002_g8255 [Phytophthora rubi]KAE9344070.1 hypothetical protein PR003_g8646 [Phytophthora rubi]